ncbi:MAG: alpha/beta fold hydrolase, partial [Patescibacteria group bacterium]
KKPYTVYDFAVKEEKVYYIANRQEPNKWDLYSLGLNNNKLNTISEDVMYTNKLTFTGDNLLFTENERGTGVLKSFNIKEKKIKNFIGIEQEKVEIEKIIRENIFTENLKGILLKPDKNTDQKKTIIWLHGGPYRQASPLRHSWGSYTTYDWILDEIVLAGITVLKLDYPGSMGYGKDYSLSLVNNIGVIDVKNVEEAIAYLNNLGLREIYLFGNSYGGYLALKGLTKLDSKLSGALAVAPVTDWQKLIEKVHPTPFEAYLRGIPNEKNQDIHDRSSVINNLEKISKPIVLFHGELDNQVPFSQSEYLFKEAKSVGKNIQYYSILGEKHVISGVSQNEAICKKVADFIGIKSTENICIME